MYLDFHTHCKLAKKLAFSREYTDWLFDQAKGAGLDALCLTEHFNTQQFERIYEYVASIARREGDSFMLKNGLRIFAGMETDIAEGGHILTVGPMESILELHSRLNSYMQKENFMRFSELMELFEPYPVLVGAAHPFRDGGHIPELPEEQQRRLDFLDLNGKDMALDPLRTEELTFELGRRLGKPVVGGSDTHQALQYGCIRTRFDEEFTTLHELEKAMRAQSYTIELHPEAEFRVKAACTLKRALKEIEALGGDYVSALLHT